MDLVKTCLEQAGLASAFGILDPEKFLGAIDDAGIYDALANQSFYLFLQSLMMPGTIPATYQKLADFGWSDDDIAKLFSGGVLKEEPVGLIYAINAGALSLSEYDQYADAPNQEIAVVFYTDGAGSFLEWIQEHMTVPKIDHAAFGG